jgi:hypothetical protein
VRAPLEHCTVGEARAEHHEIVEHEQRGGPAQFHRAPAEVAVTRRDHRPRARLDLVSVRVVFGDDRASTLPAQQRGHREGGAIASSDVDILELEIDLDRVLGDRAPEPQLDRAALDAGREPAASSGHQHLDHLGRELVTGRCAQLGVDREVHDEPRPVGAAVGEALCA